MRVCPACAAIFVRAVTLIEPCKCRPSQAARSWSCQGAVHQVGSTILTLVIGGERYTDKLVVIGSGPAGIACARALVAAGKRVVVVDGGYDLEPETRIAVRSLATRASGWSPTETRFLREGVETNNGGIPLKRAYGSDFPYRSAPGATTILCDGVDLKSSYALGGLSTVWGSAVMPYKTPDIADWPVGEADLAEGYRAVLEWMPLSATEDSISRLFPLYGDRFDSLPLSRQATSLLSHIEQNRECLNSRGVYWGRARLAVNAADCTRCGLCMYGCPHSLIYSSDQTLRKMAASGAVEYQPGVVIHSVADTPGGAVATGTDRAGRQVEIKGARVFLGAGVLNTTAILLRSLDRFDTPVVIRDSQYFLLPLLRFRGTAGVTKESLHTLAQLFFEVFDEQISRHTVHLQTYTYNDLFKDRVSGALGPLRNVFPMESFLGRLLLFQGYLHSSESPGISATLTRSTDGQALRLRPIPRSDTRARLRKLIRKFEGLRSLTGFVPISPMLEIGRPGRGYHSGGSFPMSATPDRASSDILGRPAGMQRVHAIDATVLPGIPATTITFTVMANAWRIGRLAAAMDGRSES